jgi:hypothetical protein
MAFRDGIADVAEIVLIIVGHIIAGAIAAAGIWTFEQLFRRYLWPAEDRLLFDRMPLKYMFDAADVSLFGGLITRGYPLFFRFGRVRRALP